MEDMEDEQPGLSSLMDGDYCGETTEEWEDEHIPYSIMLLMKQKKNMKNEEE